MSRVLNGGAAQRRALRVGCTVAVGVTLWSLAAVAQDAAADAGPDGSAATLDGGDASDAAAAVDAASTAMVDAAADAPVEAEAAPVEPEPAGPAPSAADDAPPADPTAVMLKGTTVFQVLVPRSGIPAEQRAARATEALGSAFEQANDEVRTERKGDTVTVYVGSTPIIQLGPEDSEAARDSSLEVHAAATADRVRQAVARERQRQRIASTVFSISLVVFTGLIAVYLMRKLGDFAERAHAWLANNAGRLTGIHLQSIEVISPALLKSSLSTGLSLGRVLGQFSVIYFWIVFALSLFETTKGYNEKLTGFLFEPVGGMLRRLATGVPILFVALIAALAVALLVRFIALFFESVERRESSVGWIPPHLARPTSVLLRVGVIVGALVFAGPVVTGDSEGAFAKVGIVLLAALGMASVPLLATLVVGATTMFSGRLRIGESTQIGEQRGWVETISLLGVHLVDGEGGTTTVPHLVTLVRPIVRNGERLAAEIVVPLGSLLEIEAALHSAAAAIGSEPTLEVVSLDVHSVRYRVSVKTEAFTAVSKLVTALAHAAQGPKPAAASEPAEA